MSFKQAVANNTEQNNKVYSDDLKRLLIQCVRAEKESFLEIADAFYEKDCRDSSDYKAICKAVIDTIDRILQSADWNESLFLRNTVQPLAELKEQAKRLLTRGMPEVEALNEQNHTLPADCVSVYISMYQSDGHNMQKWEMQLRAISRYLVGRPVYENEADVQKAIRRKLVQTSEAYVIASVKQSAIRCDQFEPEKFDRHGNKLLVLKPGAVDTLKILQFIHNGKAYRFIDGRLIECKEGE